MTDADADAEKKKDTTPVPLPDMNRKLLFLQNDNEAQAIGRHNGKQQPFANRLDVPVRTYANWISGKAAQEIPTYAYENIVKIFQFPADWQPWLSGRFEVFEPEFRKHAMKILSARAKGFKSKVAANKSALVWSPPSTKSLVLKRLKALELEELAGVEIGSGYIPLAQHRVTFVDDGEQGLKPEAGKPRSKLKLGEAQFASISFSWLMRNDASFPWPLGLDVDLGQLGDGLHIISCSIDFSFSGDASTVPVGDRKRLPGQPALSVAPEKETKRSGLRVTPHGTGSQTAGWSIELKRGPVGSFTARDLLEVVSAREGDAIDAVLIVPLKGLEDDGCE